jgi:hypothetical protein
MAINLKTKDLITACEVLGVEPKPPIVDHMEPERAKKSLDDYTKDMIADAINKESGFVIDYTDDRQRKWEVVYRYVPGVGWVFVGVYGRWHSCSGCGSRLRFRDAAHGEYFGKLILSMGMEP